MARQPMKGRCKTNFEIERSARSGNMSSAFLFVQYFEKCQYYLNEKGKRLMSELKFTAIYERAEEGGYIGYVAELPCSNTQGETLDETRENLKDAVSLLLECYREDADNRLSASEGSRKEDLILQAA